MVTKKALEKEITKADGQSRDYEMIVIISPDIADEKLDAAINNISQFITDKGGVISEMERWGKKKLAYPIKNFLEGSYVLARFKQNPTLCKELEARLKISDEVIRHLLIRVGS